MHAVPFKFKASSVLRHSHAFRYKMSLSLCHLQLAQAILIPFLVEQKNMGALGLDAVRQMIDMSPPENRRVSQRCTLTSIRHSLTNHRCMTRAIFAITGKTSKHLAPSRLIARCSVSSLTCLDSMLHHENAILRFG